MKDDDIRILKEVYEFHRHNFYDTIRSLHTSLGIFDISHLNKNGFYSMKIQSGEQKSFHINRDYNNQFGEGKLINYALINDETKANTLLFYSPTRGVSFGYSADLMNQNIQLGNNDFFGKTIENMIKNISSAIEIDFKTNVRRFNKSPNAIESFDIATKNFVPKKKQGEVISTIAILDGLVRGLHSIPKPCLYGENFKRQKEDPLFGISIEFSI